MPTKNKTRLMLTTTEMYEVMSRRFWYFSKDLANFESLL